MKTNKKIVIVHGWTGSPNTDWYKWLKNRLKEKGYETKLPSMPDTANPKIGEWVNKLKEISEPDKNTFFVGHSIGCQAILRYLAELPENVRIGGVVLVAGWFNLTDETWDENFKYEIAEPWLKDPVDFIEIKKHCTKFIVINSDDDPYVPLSDTGLFKEKLNAEIIIVHNMGHISGEDGFKDFPLVLNEIIKM